MTVRLGWGSNKYRDDLPKAKLGVYKTIYHADWYRAWRPIHNEARRVVSAILRDSEPRRFFHVVQREPSKIIPA